MSLILRKSIHQILLATGASVLTAGVVSTAVAALGVQVPPPGPGQVPDYFGVTPNYATSPQPIFATVSISNSTGGATVGTGFSAAATTYDYSNPNYGLNPNGLYKGKVMDVQIINGGSGYTSADKVTVSGGQGSAPVTLTPVIDNGASGGSGVITGFVEIPRPLPIDSTWTGLGTGFDKPISGTGIHKFVDALPSLQVATADTSAFSDGDYYEIAEVEYTAQMHNDLPATHLRGYVQIQPGGFDPTTYVGLSGQAKLDYANSHASYLGPVIVANKDRPVRVKIINLLSTSLDSDGLKGQLPFPVDHTYMGADSAENRTSVHQHGGNTPWISDGTPRQTFKPAGETGNNKGVSASVVPDMWFDATNPNKDGSYPLIKSCAGQITCTVSGATNDPGPGSSTFYFTNQQTARFMFYHDHAEGITRLNVYAGLAGGFILQDPTDDAMTKGGVVPYKNGAISYNAVLPPDVINLVIQEKTFVPDNTTPVLNFYGPFKSQLNSQDPTWHWGTGFQIPGTASGLTGTGDLWVPHVYMPNQNPGDVSGANAVGRWDYGPWFWPVFKTLDNNKILNPYYDPACDVNNPATVNAALGTCEGMYIPGVPNGNTLTAADITAIANNWAGVPGAPNATDIAYLQSQLPKLQQPTGSPEAFNDTPIVNGKAYPYYTVDPKKYRLRILSVGNDRTLNLSLFVAASKNSPDTTAEGNVGSQNQAIMCDGTTSAIPDECTEVRMVPWNATQNNTSHFPSTWYSPLKGGITFDGRPGGVPDPNSRGPAMVQIGTEAGFLSSPAVIGNQPINFEYNVKNIQVTNVKEHALLLGPAERADVVVDFTPFAGSTIILYNDAPAAIPAFDLRLDYFTGNFDNTDTGGAFSTVPGYGPNSRTIMQFRVSTNTTSSLAANSVAKQDYVDPDYLKSLTTEVQKAFKYSQDPIIVPQFAYNPVYGSKVSDALGANVSRISDNELSFSPFQNPLAGTLASPISLTMGPKTIQELFTTDYGRMNATLGTEIPNTTGINQTTIPLGYLDPPTELVELALDTGTYSVPVGQMSDGTQLWKITHNGVDTHSIHFHLFNVQIVNRVGWDGAVYPPEANELGWKETVRMNPLADVIVALRPKTMTLPFKVGNSHHLLDPSQSQGATPPGGSGMTTGITNLDPKTGNASNVTNELVNYGWEYVWHCHILGHEENDMMRSIAVATPPATPKPAKDPIPATSRNPDGSMTLNWTDDSVVANWFTIIRTDDAGNIKTFNIQKTDINGKVLPECADQSGCAMSYTDTTLVPGAIYSYSVTAHNTVGGGDNRLDYPNGNPLPFALTPGFTGYENVTADSGSYSIATGVQVYPIASYSTNSLDFGALPAGTTSPAQTATLSNIGTAPLKIASIVASPEFAQTNNCGTSLAVGASCGIDVVFKPINGGNKSGSITINDDNFILGTGTIPTQTISLSGVGTVPLANLSATALDFGTQVVNKLTAPQPITLTNSGNAPLTISSITAPANGFAIVPGGTCSAATPVAANGGTCTFNVTFTPASNTVANSTLVINDNAFTDTTSAGVSNPKQTVSLTGKGVYAPIATLTPASLSFADTVVAANSATQTITLSNTGTGTAAQGGTLTYTIGTLPAGFARTGGTCTYPAQGSLAVNATCTIIARFSPTAGQAYSDVLKITDNSFGSTSQTVTLTGNGFAGPTAPSVSGLTNNGLVLNWAAANGASAPVSYTVQRASNAAFTTAVTTVSSGSNALTANVAGLTTNTTYYFRVVAVFSAISANGAVSSQVLTLPTTPVAPTQPTGANVTASSMNLTAPAAVTGVTYKLSVNGAVVNSTGAAGGVVVTATGLTAGTTYSVNWTAINTSGSSIGAASNLLTLPTIPDATTIGAANVTATGFTLNWTAVPGAASYTVQRATVANGVVGTFGNSTTVTGNSAAIASLTSNTTYVFHISATNPAGTTLYSANSAPQTTLPATPAAPTQATATATANSLSLTAPATVTGVAYQLNLGGAVVNPTPVAGGSVVTATGLNGGTTYPVYWTAVNAGGTSNGTIANLITKPAAPLQPSVSAVSATGMTVNWSSVTGATGYTLQYSTNGGATWANVGNGAAGVRTTAASLAAASTSAVILGLTGNTSYTFQLLATDAAGAGAYSTASAVQLTAPSTPTGVSAANGTTGAPFTGGLNWTAPTGGATSYTVNWSGPAPSTASSSGTATSGQQLTFAATGTYSMTVTATNATGSSTSTAVNVTVR